MNKSKLILLIALSTIILTSCCHYNCGTIKGVDITNIYISPTVNHDFVLPSETVDYTINSAEINGDILTIDFSFKGGCEKHGFDLIFNGKYKKSLPRQADLYLLHTANGDTCQKDYNFKLDFTLKNIIGTSKQATNFTLYSFPERLKYLGE